MALVRINNSMYPFENTVLKHAFKLNPIMLPKKCLYNNGYFATYVSSNKSEIMYVYESIKRGNWLKDKKVKVKKCGERWILYMTPNVEYYKKDLEKLANTWKKHVDLSKFNYSKSDKTFKKQVWKDRKQLFQFEIKVKKLTPIKF